MLAHTIQELRFANFLSEALAPTYERIVEYIALQTGIPTSLQRGVDFDDFAAGRIDAGFICGLIYVRLLENGQAPVELGAAPVLRGARYGGQAHYFSDIVVNAVSPFYSFSDLRGCIWAYNEQVSHSGYNLVRHTLQQQGHTHDYFGLMRRSGSHAASLALVARGGADVAAIDSHVLTALLGADPALREQIRVIGSFGPSAIPPIVLSTSLPARVKRSIRQALLHMHLDSDYASSLREGAIERLVAVPDAHYDDIRHMQKDVWLRQPSLSVNHSLYSTGKGGPSNSMP